MRDCCAAGMKYMVMTTKHHNGFCLFNSKQTDYCAPKQACGRDLVAEYAEAARSEEMNRMVFELQPDIIVNNRNKLDGDFQTPEQEIKAAAKGKAWETCMTMNESWGYHWADDDWRRPRAIVRNLAICACQGGNYLLNIGPRADGSVPQESVQILTAVGKWMERNEQSIRMTDTCGVTMPFANRFTRRGKTLYVHCYY